MIDLAASGNRVRMNRKAFSLVRYQEASRDAMGLAFERDRIHRTQKGRGAVQGLRSS